VRIPLKAISVSEGLRSAFLRDCDQRSERSDAGEMIVSEVIGIVKHESDSVTVGVTSFAHQGIPN
jgi:hypothetical protein